MLLQKLDKAAAQCCNAATQRCGRDRSVVGPSRRVWFVASRGKALGLHRQSGTQSLLDDLDPSPLDDTAPQAGPAEHEPTPVAKRVFIRTFGCQMNVYDSERMNEALAAQGYVETSEPADADLAILNTCHIREKAAEKVYSDLGRHARHQGERAKSRQARW